jgi:hypothetical protein
MKNKQDFTTKDFENIVWHDCKIYGLAFDDSTYNFYLDIDFICEWIEPTDENKSYKFKVAPATLNFHNVWDISFDMETNLSLEIDTITMNNPHSPKNKEILPKDILEYDWIIELQQGEISFKSIGFDMHLRELPTLKQAQTLGIKERGGISFSVLNQE